MPDMHQDLRDLVTRRLADLGLAGKPLSYRAAEERARERGKQLNKETLRRLALGTHSGRISDETVDGLAAALAVSRGDVLRHMHETRPESLGSWEPPDSADRLTFSQRRVLEQLIRVMVNPTQRVTADDDGVDLIAVGNEGMLVAQAKGSAPLSENDRQMNEKLADQALDEMGKDQQTRRRFGGR